MKIGDKQDSFIREEHTVIDYLYVSCSNLFSYELDEKFDDIEF